MEVYVAKFDYEKEREDLLSFKEGDKFRIASKADKKWWAAYSIDRPGEYGYVPSVYIEPYVDPGAGDQAQALIESAEGLRKIATLQELKRKIPLIPASATNAPSSSSSSSDSEEDQERKEPVIIKPLTAIAQLPEDSAENQIEPKKLPNPHKESKAHIQLNKEIKLNSARGGAQNLGKPELEKVMQRRRPDAEGRVGPIKAGKSTKPGSSADTELASQLARRTLLLEEAEKQEEAELNKPEFMKLALRKTQQK